MADSRSLRAWGPQPLPRLDGLIGQRPTSATQSPRPTDEHRHPQRERAEREARAGQATRRREADESTPAAAPPLMRITPSSLAAAPASTPPRTPPAVRVARGLACEAVWISLRDEVVDPLLPGIIKEAIRGVVATRVPLRRKPMAETGRAAVAEEVCALMIADLLAEEARCVLPRACNDAVWRACRRRAPARALTPCSRGARKEDERALPVARRAPLARARRQAVVGSLRDVAQEYTAHRRAQRAFEHILSEVMREDLEGVRYDSAARLEDRERTAIVPQYVWQVRLTPLAPQRLAHTPCFSDRPSPCRAEGGLDVAHPGRAQGRPAVGARLPVSARGEAASKRRKHRLALHSGRCLRPREPWHRAAPSDALTPPVLALQVANGGAVRHRA